MPKHKVGDHVLVKLSGGRIVEATIKAIVDTLMATISTDFTSANVKILGTFTAAVYSDPTNPFGAGDLDFVYQVQNSATSPDAIARISAIDFTGWMTDVGYTATGADLGFQDGEIAPELVDRVGSGDVVGFSFSAPVINLVTPGDSSTVLIIKTNASNWGNGSASVIDGGVVTLEAFEPTGSHTVPEPNLATLLCIGLVALVGMRQFARR